MSNKKWQPKNPENGNKAMVLEITPGTDRVLQQRNKRTRGKDSYHSRNRTNPDYRQLIAKSAPNQAAVWVLEQSDFQVYQLEKQVCLDPKKAEEKNRLQVEYVQAVEALNASARNICDFMGHDGYRIPRFLMEMFPEKYPATAPVGNGVPAKATGEKKETGTKKKK